MPSAAQSSEKSETPDPPRTQRRSPDPRTAEQARPPTQTRSASARVRGSKRVSLREQQKQFTHDLFLRVGEELFHEKGFLATTIDDIAERAGTTRATFYLHFSNKDALLIELSTRDNSVLADRLAKLDDALVDGSVETIRAWLDDSFEFMSDFFKMATYWDEGLAVQHNLALLGGEYLEQTLAMFPRYRAATGATLHNRPGLQILLMLFTFERLVRWAPIPQLRVSRHEQVDTIAALWHATLHT